MTTLPEVLFACGVAAVALTIFLLVRYFREKREAALRSRLGLSDPGESGVLTWKETPTDPAAASDMDKKFESMIRGTMLDVTPEQALGVIALCGVALGGIVYLWKDRLDLGIAALVFGMLIPLVVFFFMRGRYRRRLQDQLPDALYLIARSLRAGSTLEQALGLVGEEGVKPVGDEFKRCAAAVQLGLPVHEALGMTAARVKLLDFDAFVSTVNFHRKTGGNLPLMLDRLAAGARDRNQFRGHFRAATAYGRVTAIVLALAAPLLLIGYILFEPDHVRGFLSDPQGWATLGVAFLLMIVGGFWIYNILKVEY